VGSLLATLGLAQRGADVGPDELRPPSQLRPPARRGCGLVAAIGSPCLAARRPP